ncbi:MAG TPA: acylphosphatase [Candidatus Limnocylindria bacterium]|jgi:acylphosphatase
MSGRRYVVRGRVQGVNFRAAAAAEARRLGLRGRIWNREDEAVEAIAAGPPSALDRFEHWLHRGPPLARVEEVLAEALPTDPPEVAFRVI